MVQYEDLEASTIKLPSGSQKRRKALAAAVVAACCLTLVVTIIAISGNESPRAELENLESGLGSAGRMALKRDATISKLHSSERKRSQMLRQFDALQKKIERDLGVSKIPLSQDESARGFPKIQAQAVSKDDAQPRTEKMASWRSDDYDDSVKQPAEAQKKYQWDHEPSNYYYSASDNAEASATASAARAQDAYHRILNLEKEAQAIKEEMQGRANDVAGARRQINNELNNVYDATEAAEHSLHRAASLQNQAAKVLSDAQDVRNAEIARAQRIAEIEAQVEQEAAYIEHVLGIAEHGGQYAGALLQQAHYGANAVAAIHNFLEDSFDMTKSLASISGAARSKLGSDLDDAENAVSQLGQEAEYGGHAAIVSQHYANAARAFAQHAAGAAAGAYDAVQGSLKAQETSVQAAFQAVQASKGARAAEYAASSARAGAEAALRIARGALHHCYGTAPSLPADPIERAESLVDLMAPILNKAADDLETNQGDCAAITQIIDSMKADVKPISHRGEELQMNPTEIKEVQAYADKVLGITLERLMVEMAKAVQACGPSVVGEQEGEENKEDEFTPSAPSHDGHGPDGFDENGSGSDNNNGQTQEEDDTYLNKPYDGGLQHSEEQSHIDEVHRTYAASIITAKQLVDSRAAIISSMIDKIDNDLRTLDCASIRAETENARADFNYLEAEETSILQKLPPGQVEEIDEYAKFKLLPLLQTSLDTFDEVKQKCGRKVFENMDERDGPSGEYIQDEGTNYKADGGNGDEQQDDQNEEKRPVVGPKPTALVISTKLVIDHMVRDIEALMKDVKQDPANCKNANNAGIAFRAKFQALEHIAARYEGRMGDAEKAEVEQYAEDHLGSVMEKLFTVVMAVTANCGTKSFDLLGAHDVEGFYEDEVKDTLSERANNEMEKNYNGPIGASGAPLPNGEPNPLAEETVAQMKAKVAELKKKLGALREKMGGDKKEDGAAKDGAPAGAEAKAATAPDAAKDGKDGGQTTVTTTTAASADGKEAGKSG